MRAVAAGSGIAPGILGVADRMGVGGIVVLPLDPALFLDLEVVWRRPARPAVRSLVDFLVESVDDPQVLVSAPHRPSGGGGGQGFRTTFSQPSALFLKIS